MQTSLTCGAVTGRRFRSSCCGLFRREVDRSQELGFLPVDLGPLHDVLRDNLALGSDKIPTAGIHGLLGATPTASFTERETARSAPIALTFSPAAAAVCLA